MSDPFDPTLSENRRWLSVADLLGGFAEAKIGVIGARLGVGSLSAGRCDLAPTAIREALRRVSTYDLETGADLSALRVFDSGDLDLGSLTPADAFEPIRDAVAAETARRELTLVLGGNNALTRPAFRGLDSTLQTAGLLTLDAHFDLRDTDLGLNNGNPIQALLDDGLPGSHISQIGLAPFANTRRAHDKAKRAGIAVHTLADCRANGLAALVTRELDRLSALCRHIYVDFDIDVIDRAQMVAAPGARPGGITASEFFAVARIIGARPNVRCADLTEFDPESDHGAVGALTAARWFTELLAGYLSRPMTGRR
ncbi:MAG TPA: arginase family protein [Micropepsaceae bacterium]|nr:arginase family protein [Micropepsaceae bacterium]